MGQFGNQPDFGTQVARATISGDALTGVDAYNINPPCALYVGTGGDLLVTVVGGDLGTSFPPNATLFKNVPNGTFMPVMVSNIWADYDGTTLTTAADIVGLY
jgi:hypothetical protein